MRVDVKNGRWDCYWSNILDGGPIVVQGPFYDSKDNKLRDRGRHRHVCQRPRIDAAEVA